MLIVAKRFDEKTVSDVPLAHRPAHETFDGASQEFCVQKHPSAYELARLVKVSSSGYHCRETVEEVKMRYDLVGYCCPLSAGSGSRKGSRHTSRKF